MLVPDIDRFPCAGRSKLVDWEFCGVRPVTVPVMNVVATGIDGVQVTSSHVDEKFFRTKRAFRYTDLMRDAVFEIIFELVIVAVRDADDGGDPAEVIVCSAMLGRQHGNQLRVDASKAGKVLDEDSQVLPLRFQILSKLFEHSLSTFTGNIRATLHNITGETVQIIDEFLDFLVVTL